MEDNSQGDSRLEYHLHQVRWPKLVGLEQIFQDMEIEEEDTFLNIQEARAGTEDSIEQDNKGNNKNFLIF